MTTIPAYPTTTTSTRELAVRGPFTLRESALFGFGHQQERGFDGTMRLAFRVDGTFEDAAGVAARQHGQTLTLEITSRADHETVARQVARILSVDLDATGFVELGRSDRVVGALQAVAPGLRPPQFNSPYEAAVWAILSARRTRTQAMRLRERLVAMAGETLDVAGRPLAVVPGPSALAQVTGLPGLPEVSIPRLRAIAAAAREGELDAARLGALAPDEAMRGLQRLPGIGPFYSALVVARACGLPDVVADEPRSRAAVHELCGLTEPLDDAGYAAFAQRWAPWRTWVIVHARAAAHRLTLADRRAAGIPAPVSR